MSGGIKQALSFNKIEITNLESGAPQVHLHIKNIKYRDVQVSISHTADQALAFALLRL